MQSAQFTHPLARDAKIWASEVKVGEAQNMLVIVTTLELLPDHKKFKQDKVDRLKDSAREWLSFHQDEASGFILINKLKDW